MKVDEGRRRRYSAVVLGIDSSGKKEDTLYILLDNPMIEIKVRVVDINAQYQCVYRSLEIPQGRFGTCVSINPHEKRFNTELESTVDHPRISVGQKVQLWVRDYVMSFENPSKDRWVFNISV